MVGRVGRRKKRQIVRNRSETHWRSPGRCQQQPGRRRLRRTVKARLTVMTTFNADIHTHYCYRPCYPTARFPSPSSYMVSDEPTGQGPCRDNLHRWGLTQSPSCDCGQRQTMNRTVNTCALANFEGGLNLLHAVM